MNPVNLRERVSVNCAKHFERVELAPAFRRQGKTDRVAGRVAAGVSIAAPVKAPASRTHSKRFAWTGAASWIQSSCLLLAILLPAMVAGAEPLTFDKMKHGKSRFTATTEYVLHLPKDYDARSDRRWPLILFLHGAGERGSDLSRVMIHGPWKHIERNPDFPFIVIAPQCPGEEVWNRQILLRLLDEVLEQHAVDAQRVYLTGLSMGGYGTWDLGTMHPERFAAIAPVCGGGQTISILLSQRTKTEALQTLGVWAFHGARDAVVVPGESERMLAAMRGAGVKEVKFTLYPEAAHDSWTETYNNPELYKWFLQHSREPLARKHHRVGH